jgi:hypothetical protein
MIDMMRMMTSGSSSMIDMMRMKISMIDGYDVI